MRSFQAEDFLLVRELSGDPAGCAAALLGRAYPADDAERLQRLTLGCRNARLLAVHERLFGGMLEAYAKCPHCGEQLEFALPAEAFPAPRAETAPAELELDADGGYRIRLPLLDSLDLQAAAACGGEGAARGVLLERCVVAARDGDATVDAGALPPSVIGQLAAAVQEADPPAETLLHLACAACSRRTNIPVAVASGL